MNTICQKSAVSVSARQASPRNTMPEAAADGIPIFISHTTGQNAIDPTMVKEEITANFARRHQDVEYTRRIEGWKSR